MADRSTKVALRGAVEVSAVSCTKSTEMFAMATIKGPALPPAKVEAQRAPLTISAVIDVSGSMNSEGRLNLVKESLGFMIRELTPRDSLGLVSFASEVSCYKYPIPDILTSAPRHASRLPLFLSSHGCTHAAPAVIIRAPKRYGRT